MSEPVDDRELKKKRALRFEDSLRALTSDKAATKSFFANAERLAGKMLGERGLAHDYQPGEVVDEAMVKALTGRYAWYSHEDLGMFFERVLRGVSGNLHDKEARNPLRNASPISRSPKKAKDPAIPPELMVMGNSDPAVIVQRSLDSERVKRALRRLNPLLPTIFDMLNDGHSYAQIALALNLPLRTVRALCRKLRRALGRICVTMFPRPT